MTSSPPLPASSAAVWDALVLDELLDEAANETDVLLAELLREKPPRVACEPEPAGDEPRRTVAQCVDEVDSVALTAARRPKVLAGQATRKASPLYPNKAKQTIAALQVEVNQLTSELKRLRSESTSALQPFARNAKETAIAERLKRRRVEEECRQLRAAVYAHTQFIRGLRSVFTTPLALSAMDLSHFLHNYTRLPRDRSTRWNEYKALAHETRFQSAMDLLCKETKTMRLSNEQVDCVPSLELPFIQTEMMKHDDGFSMTSTNVYALATDDLSAALRGVCVAVREIVARSHAYECTSRKKQIVDPDAALPATTGSSIVYRVMGVDHKNPLDGDELSVESRNVTLYKQANDFAVLLEDFVDDDELHPHDETTSITRQVVGAYLLRRELCSDGLQHTVFRGLRTRRYRFHEHTPPAILHRYQQLIDRTMKDNDLLFRQLIQDSIAHEEQAFAQALDKLKGIQ